jgi:Ca-activated chloride channel family protein
MTGLGLAHPLMLLLLPLPLLVRLLRPRGAGGQALYLPPAVAAGAGVAASRGLDRPGALLLLLWLCLVTALAQPQRLVEVPDRSASGRDIVLALDLSGSMAIEDFSLDGETASRLDAVKRVATRFALARRGDRIGVVNFADRAYVAAPLTWDLTAVARAIESAEIGLTGRSTAISDGLGLALKRILAEPARSRAIVLLSDGRDTAARLDPTQVARLAAENGVRVHTIALGPEDLEERPASRDAVDIRTLRAIAETSGGTTWRVRDMADLEEMAAELDRLEPNPSGRPPLVEDRPLWPWPAAAALALGLAVAWRRA